MSSRSQRVQIAQTTLGAIKNGSFIANGRSYTLPAVNANNANNANNNTVLYRPGDLSNWHTTANSSSTSTSSTTTRDAPQISVLQLSTLESAALLSQMLDLDDDKPDADSKSNRIGVLNFASATKPGGGFLAGAQAQEETIARSSTLYPSLISETAGDFYVTHKRDNRGCYYSHSIIWSPGVAVFRNDNGDWHEPYSIDIVTSPAVNAGVVRQRAVDLTQEQVRIEAVMKERMSRILYVFENHRVKNLVLGSFGTGVFKNSVAMVAKLWCELLGPGKRFSQSFERIIFGIIDARTCEVFKETFQEVSSKSTICSGVPHTSVN